MRKYFKSISDLYTLNKSIFKKNCLLFGALLIVFIFCDCRLLNIDLLNGYDVDEFYFLRILYSRQYIGFNELNPQKFFSGFYSYGRLFWIVNFIAAYIPFSLKKYNAALLIVRLMSSLFAIQSFLIFKEIVAKFIFGTVPVLLICGISLLMIYFWAVGSWIHPDWMMMFFVMLAFYYYFSIADDEPTAPINFLVAFSLAIALKVQAVQLMPLLLLYNLKEFFLQPSLTSFGLSVKKSCISGFVILFVFLILNPYLIHPQGFRLFCESFTKDMESNKTNYWSGHLPTIADKVNSYTSAYLSGWIMAITFVTTLIFIYKNSRLLRPSFEKFSFIAALLILIAYYLFNVNKIWPHYYLPVAFMTLLVFCFTYQSANLIIRQNNILLYAMMLLQIINLFLHTDYLKDWLFPSRTLAANNFYSMDDSMTAFFKKHPDSKNAHISFTFRLPIPVNAAKLDFNKVAHIPVVNEEQLHQVSKLAPYPPDYLVVQKNMYYNKKNKSSQPVNDVPVALIDSIKAGKLSTYKLADSTQDLLFIKRVK